MSCRDRRGYSPGPLFDDDPPPRLPMRKRCLPYLHACLTGGVVVTNLAVLGLFSYFVYRMQDLFQEVNEDGDLIAEGIQNITRVFDKICEGLEPMGICQPPPV